MTRLLKLPIYLATFATLMGGVLTARAGTSGIHDNAGFFSEGAKADATSNINDVQRKLKKDVCVETFAEIPADLRQGINLQDKAAVNRVCDQWAVKRAKELMVNGVYVLLVKQPAHLQVTVGNDTQRQAFTLADRDRLVSTMLTKLRAKDNDGALREGMSYVAATMRGHSTTHTITQTSSAPVPVTRYRDVVPEEPSSGGSWLVKLLIIGVVVWLGLAMFRALFRGGMRAGGNAATPDSPTRGGGFMRSMMGGMFGAAAGMWLYNQFSGGSSAYGAPPENHLSNDGGVDPGFTGQDTDYSSSGGSFGGDDSSSGGGGFFGGGDSGGGGFDGGGGGDSGGGGGGGDF